MWLLILDLITSITVIKYSLSQAGELQLSPVMYLPGGMEQKLPNKMPPYTLKLNVTWRNIFRCQLRSRRHKVLVEERGAG